MKLPADAATSDRQRTGWPVAPERFLATRAGWWTTLAVLSAALVLPLLITDFPPILDYPNHLARMFILAHPGDPVLARIWRPDWHVIPDLGLDLLLPPLMRLFSPYAVGKFALALALLAPMFGAVVYSRAVFRTRSYWPMSASLCAYSLFFVLGFINYLIAVGAALAAAGWWIAIREKPFAARCAIGAACACTLFFLHLFGVAYFAVLVGAAELADCWGTRRNGRITARKIAVASGVLAASFVGPLALWLAVPHSPHTAAWGWSLISKLFFLAGPFLTYRPWPGLLVGAAFVFGAVIWTFSRGSRHAPGLLVVVLALLLAYVVLPFAIGGGEFADSRLPLMIMLTLSAALLPPPRITGRHRRVAAVTSIGLIVALLSVVSVWGRHNKQVAALRASIAPVPPGSRVLVASAPYGPPGPYWENAPPSILALHVIHIDYHLPALLAIERRAFWPLLFSDPSQHPIQVLPPYNTLAVTAGILPDLKEIIAQRSHDPHWPIPYLTNWPAHFDYVLVIDAGGAGDLARFLPDKLTLLNRSSFAALFKVRPTPAAGGVPAGQPPSR